MRSARPWTYARVLAVWMTACVLSILLLGPLSELAPPVAARLVAGVILLPVIPLGIGALAFRAPLAGLAFLAFCVAFVLGFNSLMHAGGYLNFQRHRATYERIIAEARRTGGFHGRRYGVEAAVTTIPTVTAFFDWGDPDGFFGVVYGRDECGDPPRSGPAPDRADGDRAPTTRTAGRLGPRWRLTDEACLMRIVF